MGDKWVLSVCGVLLISEPTTSYMSTCIIWEYSVKIDEGISKTTVVGIRVVWHVGQQVFCGVGRLSGVSHINSVSASFSRFLRPLSTEIVFKTVENNEQEGNNT